MTTQTNKETVLTAYEALFNKKDASIVERYWGPKYIQHNAMAVDGVDALKDVVKRLPANTRWEAGLAIEDGDLVMLQSRFIGMGPKPVIRIDIVRLENGKMVEHWDVQQEEVTTASGHPMFSPRRLTAAATR